jgi:predicted adenylyl cyclase CyaB
MKIFPAASARAGPGEFLSGETGENPVPQLPARPVRTIRRDRDPTTAMPNRNLELKARCRDLARAADAAIALGATRAGVLEQLDTYFHFPHGRLKLRETIGRDGAELIAYDRANDPAVRGSDYHVIPIADAAAMKAALTKRLGVRGEVRKRRELFLWHNVRIHLDDVAGLGTFLEFEAVISPADDDEAISRERLARLSQAIAIRDDDRIAVSYSDLAGL